MKNIILFLALFCVSIASAEISTDANLLNEQKVRLVASQTYLVTLKPNENIAGSGWRLRVKIESLYPTSTPVKVRIKIRQADNIIIGTSQSPIWAGGGAWNTLQDSLGVGTTDITLPSLYNDARYIAITETLHCASGKKDSVRMTVNLAHISEAVVNQYTYADSTPITANSHKIQTKDTTWIKSFASGATAYDSAPIAGFAYNAGYADSTRIVVGTYYIRDTATAVWNDSSPTKLGLHAKADSAALTDTAKAIQPYPLGNAFTNDNMADTLMSLRCDTAKVHIKMRIGTSSDTLGIWYNRFNGRYSNTTWLALDSLQLALGTGLSYSSGSAKNYLNIGKNNRLRAYTDFSKAIVGGEACTSENLSWATGIVGSRKAHVADRVSFAGGSSSVTLMGENSVSVGSESCYATNSAGSTIFIGSGGTNMGRIIDSTTGNVHIGYQGKGKDLVMPLANSGNNFLWKAYIDFPMNGKHTQFNDNVILGHGQYGIFDTVQNVAWSFIGPGNRGTIEGKRGKNIYYMFKGAGKYNTIRGDSTVDTLRCPVIVAGQRNTVRASYSGILSGLNDYIDTLANSSFLFGTDCTTETPATAAFYSATGLAARPTSPYNLSIGYRRPPLADTGLKVAGRGVFGLPVTAQKVIGVSGGFKADTTVADSEWATIGRAAQCTVGLAAAIRPVWNSDISDTADAVRIADTAAAVLLARSRNVLTGRMLAVTGTGDTILLVNGANTADSAIWTFKGDSVAHLASVPVLWLGSWRQFRNRTIVDTLYSVLDSTARLSVTGSMAFTGSGLVCTTSAGNAARVWIDTVKGRVVNMTGKVFCAEVAANGTRLDIQSSSGNLPSVGAGGTWARFGNTTRILASGKSDTLLLFNPTVRSRTTAGRTVLISTNPTIDSGVVTHAEFGHNSTVSSTKVVDGWADTTLWAYKRDSIWGNRYTGGKELGASMDSARSVWADTARIAKALIVTGIPSGAPACSAGVGTRVIADTLKAAYANIPTLATTGYLSTRPEMNFSSFVGSGKPTAVAYGAWDGFSLPAYAANEEMHWRDYVPGRWDSISDPTYTVSFALDGLEDVNDTVRLVLNWTSKKFDAGTISNTYKQDTVKVPIVTGRNVAYSVYTATFTLDYDNVSFPIAYGSEITGDLRRAEAGTALDITGEIIVLDQRLTYRVDKAFKATP